MCGSAIPGREYRCTMSDLEISIPGKVMLSGEYAVMHGGTAVLVPVERYLHVSSVSDPQPLQRYPHAFRTALEYPIDELKESDSESSGFILDDSEFFHVTESGQRKKLGIGSSAAQAAAAVAIRFARAGLDWRSKKNRIVRYAIEAHRLAQAGAGSGADVAACVMGIPVSYRLEQHEPQVHEMPSDSLPSLTLLWTGQPADTRSRIALFEKWLKSDAPDRSSLFTELITVGDELAASWSGSKLASLYEITDQYLECLARITNEAGIDYFPLGFSEIDRWAKSNGCRVKPTGAGGGDMLLLVGDAPLEERKELVLAVTTTNGSHE